MTLGSLHINAIAVDRFGGLRDLLVTLPGHRLTVIKGSNEAGKSTLTELIAWLLAGPGGTAANASRFGDPRDRIGGRLEGTLRDLPFRATGRFEVLQKGAPNDSGLTVSFGGELDADAWRATLGGLDSAVLDAVYRMWGEHAHDGGGVEAHLSRVALAGVAGLADPRQLVEEFERQGRRLARGRGADGDSVLAVHQRVEQLRGDLRVAGNTAAEHASARRLLAERRSLRSDLVRDQQRHRTGASAARTALDLVPIRAETIDTEARLRDVPTVPSNWSPIVEDPPTIHQAVSDLDSAQAAADTAARDLERIAADLGMRVDQLRELTVTDADLGEAARIIGELDRARTNLRDAEHELASANEAHRQATVATDRRLGSQPEAPAERDALDRAALDRTAQSQLLRHLDRWEDLLRRHRDLDDRARHAQRELETKENELRRAQEAWGAYEVGIPASAWIHHRAVPSSDPAGGSAGSLTHLVIPALLAAVAIIAAVAQAWIPVLIAILAALIAVWFTHRRDGSDSTVDDRAIADMHRTANTVIEAERRHAELHSAAERSRAEADDLHSEIANHRDHVSAAFSGCGLPVPVDPDHGHRLLVAWTESADALVAERQRHDVAQRTASAREDALRHVRGVESSAQDLLARWGAPAQTPSESIEDLARRLRDASQIARAEQEARRERDEARRTLGLVLAPVVAEVADWRPARIVEHVDHLATIESQRQALEKSLRDLRREIEIRLTGDPAARDLLERSQDTAALHAMLAAHERDLDETSDRIDSVSEEIGALERRVAELEQAERIAQLQLELGAEEERMQELAADAAAHAIAAGLLRTVAEEYERANQPRMVARATELVRSVAPEWDDVLVRPAEGPSSLEIVVHQRDGSEVSARRLSTGARALLYLAFRLSLAEHDAERRGVRLPVLCDDPLVHLDDRRARQVVPLLARVAADGHQVLLFTCHQRTVDAAREVGAEVVELPHR